MLTAPISEIFVSIQGEGLTVGERQLFLRVAGCNLDCLYCDTEQSIPAFANVYYDETSEAPTKLSNPLSSEQVYQVIQEIQARETSPLPVALTGGEPLLKSAFLKELLPQLKATGIKILLETNGILANNLGEIITYLDIISMDLKLPSQLKGVSYLSQQREFLAVASQHSGLYLKVIVTPEATYQEVEEVLTITRDLPTLPPLILQPVTTQGALGVPKDKILTWQKTLNYPRILVIPQTHVYLGLR